MSKPSHVYVTYIAAPADSFVEAVKKAVAEKPWLRTSS